MDTAAIAGNTAWLLTAVVAVALMLPGLAMFYGGMVSRRVTMNMMIDDDLRVVLSRRDPLGRVRLLDGLR